MKGIIVVLISMCVVAALARPNLFNRKKRQILREAVVPPPETEIKSTSEPESATAGPFPGLPENFDGKPPHKIEKSSLPPFGRMPGPMGMQGPMSGMPADFQGPSGAWVDQSKFMGAQQRGDLRALQEARQHFIEKLIAIRTGTNGTANMTVEEKRKFLLSEGMPGPIGMPGQMPGPMMGMPGQMPGQMPGTMMGMPGQMPGQMSGPMMGMPGQMPGQMMGMPGQMPGQMPGSMMSMSGPMPGQMPGPMMGMPGQMPGQIPMPGPMPQGPMMGMPGQMPGPMMGMPGQMPRQLPEEMQKRMKSQVMDAAHAVQEMIKYEKKLAEARQSVLKEFYTDLLTSRVVNTMFRNRLGQELQMLKALDQEVSKARTLVAGIPPQQLGVVPSTMLGEPQIILGAPQGGIVDPRVALMGQSGVMTPRLGMMNPPPGMMGPHPVMMGPQPGMRGPHNGMMGPHSAMMGQQPGMLGPHPGMMGPHPGMMGSHSGMMGPHPGMVGPHPGMVGSQPTQNQQMLMQMQRRHNMMAGQTPAPEGFLDKLKPTTLKK